MRESIEYRVEQLENNPSGASTFTDLTDTPASYTGQTGKFVKVNAGETALEFATLAGGGDLLSSNNLSDVSNVATARTNLGLNTTANQTDSTDKRFMTDAQESKLDAITGTNTGDQTSIVGISGTKAQFDTACSDGNFLYVGDVTQYTDENAQDAVGAMVANSTFVNLAYVDGTPSLTPSLSATGTPSSTTFLRGDNTWATPTDPEGWTVIVKSANQDVTGSSTVSDDTDLQFSVVAGGHYMIDANITISGSNQNNDYKFAFNVSSGTMKGNGTVQHLSTTGAVANTLVQAGAAASTTEVGCAATGGTDIDSITCIRIAYSFTASANATFKYRFALFSASAGIIARTWKGSILKYKRID